MDVFDCLKDLFDEVNAMFKEYIKQHDDIMIKHCGSTGTSIHVKNI